MKYLLAFLVFFAKIYSSEHLPEIIAFLGSKGVGKDTAADFLVARHHYQKYALADPMKVAIKSLFHLRDEQLWGNEKEMIDPDWQITPRELMQFIGIDTLFFELGKRFPQIGNQFYLKRFDLWRNDRLSALIVISDLRMQQDLIALKERGAYIIYLQRPGIERNDPHISESDVSLVEGYDLAIINDGTIEELERKIEQALARFTR